MPLKDAMVRAILASATPERDDRLFPGDPEQFASGGLSVGHGAAGVLYALREAGEIPAPEHVAWLRDRARTAIARPGLWTGGHGVAYVLDLLGFPDDADALLERCADTRPPRPGLAGGATGIALTLLGLAQRRADAALLDRAVALAGRIAALEPGPAAAPGLLRGWTGPALLFLRLYEHTGDRDWLDRAESALNRDLAACVTARGGGLQVPDGRRTLPYLDHGSAGLLVVASGLAQHRAVPALPDLIAGCRTGFTVYPGLMNGRAGLLAALEAAGAAPRNASDLGLYAVPWGGGVAFPGVTLRRLSMDLHTGTAGVLLAVTRRPAPITGLATAGRVTEEADAGRGTGRVTKEGVPR